MKAGGQGRGAPINAVEKASGVKAGDQSQQTIVRADEEIATTLQGDGQAFATHARINYPQVDGVLWHIPLMTRRGRVLSKRELADYLYPHDEDRDSNVLEVLLGRLRRKLDPDGSLLPIETLRGRGYRFTLGVG